MSHGIYLSESSGRRTQGPQNPLIRKINRAVRMSLSEPDLALNLDVADYINEKQGATSRDACVTVVKLINNRDTHTAVFALALLDVLVKNCGYPVHLQISRKEFLNELVKRFPEHPPMRYSRVQRLILTAVEEWYQTICKHSPYKDDMGFIRDMHRLLKYKGYVFPKIDQAQLAVLKPSNHLKTASEIQKEQEIAQAAKLEELIRRGRPEDLREANKLMKVMAGFKADNVVNAKNSIAEELKKLKRKADLLNEMLSSDKISDAQNETATELYAALKSAQPKFQAIIEEEHEDDSLVSNILQFNDTVNQILEKFDLLKHGDTAAAAQIQPSSMSDDVQKNVGGALANEINLIDFGDMGTTSAEAPANTNNNNTAPASSSNVDLLGDLLGDINISDNSQSQNNFGAGGSITLGTSPMPGTPAEPITTEASASTNNNGNNLDFLGISNAPAAGNSLDLLGGFSSTNNTTTAAPSNANNDMLDFLGGSMPQANVAQEKHLVNQSSNLKIEFSVQRENPSSIKINASFSNLSSSPISDLTFMVAVPKTMTLKLQPQSGNVMQGNALNGITQEAIIENALANSSKPLKVKWLCNYNISSNPVQETAIYVLPKV